MAAIGQPDQVTQSDDRWAIGLDAWIIQDGNYPDFQRDQVAEFAVEFYFPEPPTRLEASTLVTAHHVDDATYDIQARVVTLLERVWVLDCGIHVFQDDPAPPNLRVGDIVSGRAYLSVDHFAYFERLHAKPDMPPLVYTWRIDTISMQTAPFVEIRPRLLARDPAKLGLTPIDKTDAWHHDDGSASYVLDCARLALRPKRTSATAT